jgi:ribose-phosphate pyrophosphokinase
MFFSGGEPHVVIADPERLTGAIVILDARVSNMNDLGMLLAVTDAVKRCGAVEISLHLPYFPGGRQDRLEKGFAFTCSMYADIINLQEYTRVWVLDPHSPVTEQLVDRCVVLSQIPLIRDFIGVGGHMPEYPVGLICPDEGAIARTKILAKEIGCPNVVFAHKKRDPRSGKLTGFTLDPLPIEGPYLLADDICDAGGTFMGTAGQYLEDPRGTGPLYLWVTHGIFSRGVDGLAEYFAGIGCSNSFPSTTNPHPQLQVIDILDTLSLKGVN